MNGCEWLLLSGVQGVSLDSPGYFFFLNALNLYISTLENVNHILVMLSLLVVGSFVHCL